MTTVGVRELRQQASRLLDRVEAGESIEITNHGRPVARLVPIDLAYPRPFATLVGEGLIRPGAGRAWEVTGVPAAPGAPTGAELIDEQRDER